MLSQNIYDNLLQQQLESVNNSIEKRYFRITQSTYPLILSMTRPLINGTNNPEESDVDSSNALPTKPRMRTQSHTRSHFGNVVFTKAYEIRTISAKLQGSCSGNQLSDPFFSLQIITHSNTSVAHETKTLPNV